MKQLNIFLLLSFLFLSICTKAQEEEPVNLNKINDKKHEFKIDALEGLGIPALDISYEYVLNRYSSVGISISTHFEGADIDFPQDFAITPYFRQYFFNKKDYGARGFFVEGLLQYATGEGTIFDFNEQEKWNQFGVGVALGKKWVSRNGFVIEFHGGGGRYLGNDENAPGGFARIGVNLGYRF